MSIKEIEKVLKEFAYYDDYGDLNISEQDYSKIASAISKLQEQSEVVAEGEVNYELDPLGLPYNCSVGTVGIEDIIIGAITGKRDKKVKIILEVSEHE